MDEVSPSRFGLSHGRYANIRSLVLKAPSSREGLLYQVAISFGSALNGSSSMILCQNGRNE